jgi:hypothetical protein
VNFENGAEGEQGEKRHRDAPSLYKTPKRVRRLQKFLKKSKNIRQNNFIK